MVDTLSYSTIYLTLVLKSVDWLTPSPEIGTFSLSPLQEEFIYFLIGLSGKKKRGITEASLHFLQ